MEISHVVITIIMLIQLVLIPALLIGWLALSHAQSLGAWLLQSLAVASLLLLMNRLLDWAFLSDWGRYAVWILFAAALVYSGVRVWGKPVWVWPEGRAWAPLVVSSLVLIAAAFPLANSLRGLRVPEAPVELVFPLQGGSYHVAHGGSQAVINAHMKVAAPDLHAWRGQLWALDIVKLYPAGNRARGFFPKNLADYSIFGEPVYAPCSGEVAAVENELPDLIPPESDPVNKPGNYVLVRCGEQSFILLAHLKQGSVTVLPGEMVTVGDRLGEVGNSGNTSEPHLHISAQRGAGVQTILDAEPRPMLFDGAWLVRNDVVNNDRRANQ